jgi:hypothetical protein
MDQLSLIPAAKRVGTRHQTLRELIERGDVRAERIRRGERIEFRLDPVELDEDWAALGLAHPGKVSIKRAARELGVPEHHLYDRAREGRITVEWRGSGRTRGLVELDVCGAEVVALKCQGLGCDKPAHRAGRFCGRACSARKYAPETRACKNCGEAFHVASERRRWHNATALTNHLSIVLRFRTTSADTGDHSLSVRLEDPNGIQLLPPDGQTLSVGPPTGHKDEEHYVQVVMSFGGLPITSLGTYHFTVELDGKIVRRLKLPVTQAPS